MQPRLLLRTHYQVEEPAYVEFLVKSCTSATQSAYAEVVAARLKEEIEKRCAIRFNIAAAGYAVDLGKALGLLTPNNTWTEKGHLVNLIAEVNGGGSEEQLTLSQAERLLHFYLFLEADGAAFVSLARFFEEHGVLVHAEAMNSPFVENMFFKIYSAYLSMTSNTADRVALRSKLDQLRSRGYAGQKGSGKTRQHKLDIHLQTLYRLGLVKRLDGPDGIVYRLPDIESSSTAGLKAFLSEVPDLSTLEKRIAAQDWLQIGAAVLGMPHAGSAQLGEGRKDEVVMLLIRFYQQVVSLGTPLCPLSTIVAAIQISALVERGWSFRHDTILNFITDEQKDNPKDIRFHVDRRGQPAFIKLSDRWLSSVTS